ncbi:hypothetical protein J6590_029652 [Homalodisca vitripennis]|nr:hypothetical protein J6590_029652 [Homalodisca vitripennis]
MAVWALPPTYRTSVTASPIRSPSLTYTLDVTACPIRSPSLTYTLHVLLTGKIETPISYVLGTVDVTASPIRSPSLTYTLHVLLTGKIETPISYHVAYSRRYRFSHPESQPHLHSPRSIDRED